MHPIRLAVIVGSVPGSRTGPVVAKWFVGEAGHRDDVCLDVVDLTTGPPLSMARPTWPPETADAHALGGITPRLAAADAFVIVTPEYNRSFPAVLKNAIDWHFTEWHAKPVGFVSYGGRSGGLRAVEQLRLVFGELHAVPIRDVVSFHGSCFDEAGVPRDRDGCDAAAKGMLDQLIWWATALREARAARPYQT
ncbi:NADPH-dependent FMN reductase [Kibdelosporangium persicum]|uniref:FMN-dependent NADPH-azoreductase n=1 Tax=Kibdelosporangium persicum TaxID=2698649 RepID=A0ABX2F7P1_9PSEU|nr:NAD(P)H-dependent oxidoreductase [Kibdelosporangium persicum]NRN67218.1 FMN-dependent NADPH-azoreductase [Kibdelosporangium persicum]